jgi:hypothetical protein
MVSGQLAVAWMSIFAGRIGLATVLAALCLGGRTAHAQAGPVPYWLPNWPLGFGGTVDQGPVTDGNFPGFDGSGASQTRYNFPNGWFLGSTSSSMSMNGFSRLGTFSNFGSLSSEGTQFGYNFKNAPVSIYAGFDTLKYNTGAGGPFAPFDSMSGTLPGYSAQAGIEFRPTSNFSLSLGVGVTQQPGRIDSIGAAPFAVGR